MKTVAYKAVARRLGVLAVGAVMATLLGCGDSAPPAKAPGSQGAAGGVPTGMGPLQSAPDAQYGMSDAPSWGGASDRPQMNASAAGLYQQGMQSFVAGDLAAAKNYFTQATQSDERAYQAYYSLGVVQERLKEDAAGASYRQAFKIVPDYEPAIVAFGLFRARRGALSEADSFLTGKQGELPESPAVASALAEVKSLQNDTGTAQKLAQDALKMNPDFKPAMVVIARDHYRQRRLDLSLYALKAILDGFEPVSENPPRDKDNPEALLIRGLIYREQGHRADAMIQFQRAVQRRPDMVEARVQLATMLLEAGDAQQALPLLEGAVMFDKDSLPAHLNLGDAYRLLGRTADAKKEFDWVLARDKSLPQVHYNLGLLYLFSPSMPGMTPMQQVNAAMKSLEKYQELRPKGERDDSDELLQRAKLKKGEIEAQQAAAAPAPAS